MRTTPEKRKLRKAKCQRYPDSFEKRKAPPCDKLEALRCHNRSCLFCMCDRRAATRSVLPRPVKPRPSINWNSVPAANNRAPFPSRPGSGKTSQDSHLAETADWSPKCSG